ncbi:hypothetical protein G7054_g1997 [Neopestalotiopsis clavispora]|nr:hypothetical protein G7054_g1997 [Neopestalotiopsis clavispora]
MPPIRQRRGGQEVIKFIAYDGQSCSEALSRFMDADLFEIHMEEPSDDVAFVHIRCGGCFAAQWKLMHMMSGCCARDCKFIVTITGKIAVMAPHWNWLKMHRSLYRGPNAPGSEDPDPETEPEAGPSSTEITCQDTVSVDSSTERPSRDEVDPSREESDDTEITRQDPVSVDRTEESPSGDEVIYKKKKSEDRDLGGVPDFRNGTRIKRKSYRHHHTVVTSDDESQDGDNTKYKKTKAGKGSDCETIDKKADTKSGYRTKKSK